MNIPKELKYTPSHEWARVEPDGTVSIGITDHAQEQLGDIVFVEAPKAGRKVAAGEAVGVVESVKAASDIYAPVAGEVVAGNDALADSPEQVNADAYGELDVPHQARQRRRPREAPRRRRLREARLRVEGTAMPDTNVSRATLDQLEDRAAFGRRHVGPDAKDEAAMLALLGFASREALMQAVVPASIRRKASMALPAGKPEAEALADLRAIAAKNRVLKLVDRAGLLRHAHAGRDPAEHPREPRLVHGLHAVPAGDLAGAAGGAGELPDDGVRPDGDGHRQRLDARRGDGRGRGDDALPALRRARLERLRGGLRRPAADHRRPAHARGAAGLEIRVAPAGGARFASTRSPCSCSTPAWTGKSATTARSPRRCTPRAAIWWPPPTSWRSPCSPRRASGARTWSWAPRSASACPWATAARTRATSRRAMPSSAACPGAWSA